MKLLVADDHASFRTGLLDLLSTVPDVEVVGAAANGREAVEAARALAPDVVLMDVRMPLLDGIAATKAIVEANACICILVLTTFDEDELVSAAIAAGARGYLLKGTPIDDVMEIVRLALRGYTALGPNVKPQSIRQQSPDDDALALCIARMTEREREIWALLGVGATNAEIARRLALSEGTVKNYVSGILGALGVRHRTQAALLWRTSSKR